MENVVRIQIGLVVPRDLVKKTKDTLQAMGKLDKTIKIRPISCDRETFHVHWNIRFVRAGNFHVPTTIRIAMEDIGVSTRTDLVNWTGMQDHQAEIGFVGSALSAPIDSSSSKGLSGANINNPNLLAETFDQWLSDLLQEEHERSGANSRETMSKTEALSSGGWTYMVYPPLLLLPPSTSLISWSLRTNKSLSDNLSSLYDLLCKNFKVTHIALNAPIPVNKASQLTAQKPFSEDENNRDCLQQVSQAGNNSVPNILRSPTSLTPLYGDFGPDLLHGHDPTTADFASAFWCTSRQNGIFQIWAPRYTMFSRGNISEKARILMLESLTEERLGTEPEQTSAVDLYAGIGYFAFSYVSAGVGKVLCWEINSWSIEGLRRGAGGNKWSVKVIESDEPLENIVGGDERLLVFPESNEHAATWIEAMRGKIPPVKHVNCGLLPSSKDSWDVAVQVLDSAGGWLHVHENIAKKDIESTKEEIVEVFLGLTSKYYGQKPKEQRSVECEHVELVKSYAPGVMHCVLDITVAPIHPV